MKKIKNIKHIIACLFFLAFATACDKGIDPITAVAPGADTSAPAIIIKYPTEGVKIQVPELVTSVDIQFEATDDIELKSISVKMDGTEIVNYSDFKDYRRAIKEYLYNKVTNGVHTLTIDATDMQGKTTSTSVKFEKKPPYVALYAGETFYMPFDGDFVEKITFKAATVVGAPGFAGTGLKGINAYAGATDSYLSFPLAGLTGTEFTGEMWIKLNGTPDRAGIIAISPPNTSGFDETRKHGLRFFREADNGYQRIKLNVGQGSSEVWNNGGLVTPSNNWVHLAFTVSQTNCVVYINGAVAATVATGAAIDWTGCSTISIFSGAPNFVDWGHKSDLSQFDELRFFNRALTQAEIQTIIQNDSPYVAKYPGEVFYMPFEGNYKEMNTNTNATKVGSPTFADGKKGQAYAGAADSYLTYPATALKSSNFSAVFWTKINSAPDRAGILVMSPEDKTNASYPTVQNNRNSGFRFFREGSATQQIFKLNAGNGTADSWFDGGASATVTPITNDWVHLAFTISGTECVVYINGEVVKQGSFSGIDWTGCDLLSIMSGAPRFTEWNHLSDLGMMDELRIFNKTLTQTEVKTIMNAEK